MSVKFVLSSGNSCGFSLFSRGSKASIRYALIAGNKTRGINTQGAVQVENTDIRDNVQAGIETAVGSAIKYNNLYFHNNPKDWIRNE